MLAKIVPFLWFDTQAEEAAEFYTSVFPDSRIVDVSRYGEGGPREAGLALTVVFELDGQRFTALNGGPQHRFTESVSFQVSCASADEVDHYWDALTDGGAEGRCGWLQDRYGLSWQVVPDGLGDVLGDADPGRAARAMAAMLGMGKLDLAAMRRAADEDPCV